jgi:hypothetical protein
MLVGGNKRNNITLEQEKRLKNTMNVALFTKTNLADRFKRAWIKTVISSSLVCVCFHQWLHIGCSRKPQLILCVVIPFSSVTESNNPYFVRYNLTKKKKSDNHDFRITVKISG